MARRTCRNKVREKIKCRSNLHHGHPKAIARRRAPFVDRNEDDTQFHPVVASTTENMIGSSPNGFIVTSVVDSKCRLALSALPALYPLGVKVR